MDSSTVEAEEHGEYSLIVELCMRLLHLVNGFSVHINMTRVDDEYRVVVCRIMQQPKASSNRTKHKRVVCTMSLFPY